MRLLFFWGVLFGLALLNSCGSHSIEQEVQSKEILDSNDKEYIPIQTDTTLLVFGHEVHLKFPKENAKASMVLLPGWNFPANQWCDTTELCQKALELGYVLILPEMGKSIYCSNLYPETRLDWRKFPTRSWFTDSLTPLLQEKYNLLIPGQNNFIVGLSTGARGAVLISLDQPTIYRACAALSGDYDQTQYPNDNLYRGFYGNYSNFSERWKANDNVITSIQDYKVPTYLGHGQKDAIVDPMHSEILLKALEKIDLNVVIHRDPTAGHDYSYWNSEVQNVLNFFEEKNK